MFEFIFWINRRYPFFDNPWQYFWFSTNSVQMRVAEANVQKKLPRLKWMRLGHPGSTTQTRITFTMRITHLSTLMIAVPGKCIMISNPDVFQCVNLLSFSLGTKLSFHWNKKLVGKGFKRNCTMGIYIYILHFSVGWFFRGQLTNLRGHSNITVKQ